MHCRYKFTLESWHFKWTYCDLKDQRMFTTHLGDKLGTH